MKIIILLILTVFNINGIHARPVSYPGGWTVMQMNAMNRHQLHLHYSPTAKYSIGYKGEYWSDEKIRFNSIQYNRLIKRWNKPQEQANFYWKAGLGTAKIVQPGFEGSHLSYFTGFAADWETRRYFTSYENRYYNFNSYGNFFSQKARIGIAPYIGDYGDLHTWLMLQVDHHPIYEQNFSITPLLRLFKGAFMFEAGYSNQDDYLLNFIIRL